MDYFYTDYGNHETWNSSLQGGSFCRLHRLHRFFYATDSIFAAMGSDNFRLDSQTTLNTANPLGLLITRYSDVGEGEFRYSPVGIVEDENSEHGRYFALKYVGGVDNDLSPTSLVVYDSPYLTELSAGAFVDSWVPQATIPLGAEQGMRVVNLGGDVPASDRTYLYYLEPSATSTILYYVPLPDAGAGANVAAPVKVVELDILSKNRIYVVHIVDNTVGIYVGDNDRAQNRRTVAVLHNPVTNTLLQDPFTLVANAIPFPQSYAACQGRGDEIHLVMEPLSSWRDGWGTHRSDRPDTEDEQVAPRHKSSGNEWVLYSLIENGRVVDDQMAFDGTDIQPWLGSSWADSMGGKTRVSVIPWFMCRQTHPPMKFHADYGLGPMSGDTSFAYHLTASVNTRQNATSESFNFVQRTENVFNAKPAYGNHRSTGLWTTNTDQPFAPNPVASRTAMNLLVPGVLMIEPLAAEQVGTFEPMTTLGTQANRLDSWRIRDQNAPYGQFNFSVLDPPAPPEKHNLFHNPSTDCIHGVQAGAFDVELGFIVGWFTNGQPPVAPA